MINIALTLLVFTVTFMVVYGIYFGVEFTYPDGQSMEKKDCPGFFAFWLGMITHPFKAMDNSLWYEKIKFVK